MINLHQIDKICIEHISIDNLQKNAAIFIAYFTTLIRFYFFE